MFESSGSDSDGPPSAVVQQTRHKMKSLFTSDHASGASRKQATLRYDQEAAAAATGATAAGVPPTPGQQQTAVAGRAAVIAFRGDTQVGPASALVAAQPASGAAAVMLVDRERRPLAKIRVDESLQLLPSAPCDESGAPVAEGVSGPADMAFATLYDPAAQLHWSLRFRSGVEMAAFVAAALTVQHHMLLVDGPRAPVVELMAPVSSPVGEAAATVARGSTIDVSFTVWLRQRCSAPGARQPVWTCGKAIEEVLPGAPRRVRLGNKAVMAGIEEACVGQRAGAVRLLFLGPKKTKSGGLGNPELGPDDSVVVWMRIHAIVEPPPAGAEAAPAPGDEPLAIEPRPSTAAAAPAAAAAAPAVAQQPLTEGLMLQSLLVQTLQQQLQRPPVPPVPVVPMGGEAVPEGRVPAHVERSLDRINQQLSSLYEKVDRLDIDRRLEANNATIERMVKKAVGKMPANDVDIEDMGKDRDALLAKVEAQRGRIEELTDQYHLALRQLGDHKEVAAALKADLSVEREAGVRALAELKERRRLEQVEAAVRQREEAERAHRRGYGEGEEVGRADGFQAGRLEAMAEGGSAGVQELRDEVSRGAQRAVALEQRAAELEMRLVEERRQATDRQTTLQALVARLEEREQRRATATTESGVNVGKAVRRLMNATYGQVETALYATGKESVDVQETLSILLVAVKAETRSMLEELKREARQNAVAALPPRPVAAPAARAAGAVADEAPAAASQPAADASACPADAGGPLADTVPACPPPLPTSSSTEFGAAGGAAGPGGDEAVGPAANGEMTLEQRIQAVLHGTREGAMLQRASAGHDVTASEPPAALPVARAAPTAYEETRGFPLPVAAPPELMADAEDADAAPAVLPPEVVIDDPHGGAVRRGSLRDVDPYTVDDEPTDAAAVPPPYGAVPPEPTPAVAAVPGDREVPASEDVTAAAATAPPVVDGIEAAAELPPPEAFDGPPPPDVTSDAAPPDAGFGAPPPDADFVEVPDADADDLGDLSAAPRSADAPPVPPPVAAAAPGPRPGAYNSDSDEDEASAAPPLRSRVPPTRPVFGGRKAAAEPRGNDDSGSEW